MKYSELSDKAQMSFKEWYKNADMPTRREDGTWVDLEDGIPYVPGYTQITQKALDARALAKAAGGIALTGTAKQKNWAEKIRAEKLAQMSAQDQELCCKKSGLGRTAKFWIENRERSALEIANFFRRTTELREQFDVSKLQALADEYNALTSKFGFD